MTTRPREIAQKPSDFTFLYNSYIEKKVPVPVQFK